jgi:hypothetical protein
LVVGKTDRLADLETSRALVAIAAMVAIVIIPIMVEGEEVLNVFPSLKGGDFFNKRTTLRPGKSQ